jgi:hypothetical protein
MHMGNERGIGSRRWYLLLLIPVVGLLATPIYTGMTPELFGFPFFYWYQFAWVPVAVAITYFVYTRTRTRGLPPDERRDERFGVPFEPAPSGGAPATTSRREATR